MPKGHSVNKKPKDPNAPKRAQSSYFLFSNERRPVIAAENKGLSVTDISKTISSEWKAMDAAAKKIYEEKSLEKKKEYKLKLSEYEKTEHFRQYQIKLNEWKALTADIKKRGKPPTKPKQPESMPKRPQSSYFVFSNARRKEMRDECPDKKLTELSKLIAAEWKLKTSDEKKSYEETAKENKIKYENTMNEYKKSAEYNKYMEELAEFKLAKKRYESGAALDDKMGGVETQMSEIKISLPRKPKDNKCPKRPLTSYFLYANGARQATRQEFPSLKITEIAKEISKKWKLLSEEEKKPYSDEAITLKEKYKKDLAEYQGSDAQIEFKKKLNEWKLECDRRKAKAKAHAQKKAAQVEKERNKKVSVVKKSKQQMNMDTDSDSSSSSGSYSSDSDSSSGSGSDSDSSSSGSYY